MERVGLLGPPASGKTTFLAALSIAASQSPYDARIFGADEESADFLRHAARVITRDRQFPEATMPMNSHRWTMSMNAEVQASNRRRFGRQNKKAVVRAQFEIDSQTPERSPDVAAGSPRQQMAEYLAGHYGLILLFDPIQERRDGGAYDYFQHTLLEAVPQILGDGMFPGSRLPHYVAVCMTKFDSPDVYLLAREFGYISYDQGDPSGLPRVRDSEAERFFSEFCRRSRTDDGEMLRDALGNNFHHDRTRYFITSSIGFHIGESGKFHHEDWQNADHRMGGNSVEIRGRVRPINVLEPLLWLGQMSAQIH